MTKYLLPVALAVVFVIAARLSAYTVDASEYAYVTLLGTHLATHDGSDAERGAGLHVGWPWPLMSVQRLDRRLQQFDLPATELLTHDPKGKTIDKMLLVEAFVCWRIAGPDAVDLFVRRIGSVERANAILDPRVRSELGAAIGQMKMDQLVSTVIVDEAANKTLVDLTVATLHNRLLTKLAKPLRDEYGIELVDVRLRRFSHPQNVRNSIFDRIRSDRMRKVAEHESEGKRLASSIESKAALKARTLLAEAKADEEKAKGAADAEAMKLRNDAQREDPEFYAFLQKMERLKSILGDNRTVLLLSTHRPLFESLFNPPRPKVDAPDAKDDKKKGGG